MARRVSLEQRQKLFAFMQGHEDFARGLISGPDAARTKHLLLVELAEELNSLGTGATKTPEKWFKVTEDVPTMPEVVLEMEHAEEPTASSPQPTWRRRSTSASDPLPALLERQAAAIEHMADGMHKMAAALQQIAAALQPEALLPLD